MGNSAMDAERLILETDASGNLRHVPKLPPNKQLEAIFLVVGDVPAMQPEERSISSLNRGKAMAAALAKVAEGGTFSDVDPFMWQRDIRQERGLPDRES
ncbi:MAG: hypothetical protein ACFE0I_16010 [Elainellaceae cyanobacterium]